MKSQYGHLSHFYKVSAEGWVFFLILLFTVDLLKITNTF